MSNLHPVEKFVTLKNTFLFSCSFSQDSHYVCWRWKTLQCRIRSSNYLMELRKFNPAQKNRGLLYYLSKQLSLASWMQLLFTLKCFSFPQNAHDNIICAIVYNGKYLFTSSHSCIKVSQCTLSCHIVPYFVCTRSFNKSLTRCRSSF